MPHDAATTLCELVAIPSVNPMGRPGLAGDLLEWRVTDYLQRCFHEWGIFCVRQAVHPRRDNILAVVPGTEGMPVIMLEAHQDTVPVDGMTIPPFSGERRKGRVYGRGACDVKGGMAAMLHAFHRLAMEPPGRRPTVVLACTVNEEFGYTGAQALAELEWGSLGIPRRPDCAVVAEPTSLHVVVAHKGAVRWRCHTHGRSAHSSRPEDGRNAIFAMAPVLEALEHYQRNVVATLAEHPRCGRPTLSVGVIHGGLSVNTVPESCTIEIDRRLVPGEDPRSAVEHVVAFVQERLEDGAPISHEPPFLVGDGLEDDANQDLARRLLEVARGVAAGRQATGVPYGTNAAVYAKAGIPCVVFGPGSIAQAHTTDEWIEVHEVEQAAEILFRFFSLW